MCVYTHACLQVCKVSLKVLDIPEKGTVCLGDRIGNFSLLSFSYLLNLKLYECTACSKDKQIKKQVKSTTKKKFRNIWVTISLKLNKTNIFISKKQILYL